MLRAQPLLTNDDDLRRFRAEAQAAAGLDHPGIVPIYEVGEHEGQGYFSMKFIEGGTLHLRAGEFREPRAAAALIEKVARAVHHAHEHGILHRDLKPGNILIDRTGAPQVVDFGIARQIGLESDLTHTGQIIGTPHYMSPEQARGTQRGLTAAADIYSLGAILYELLAGKKLFDGETMLTLLRQVTEQAPAPLQIGDRALESIVMRCLEKQPAARYGSAAALADDLERWLRGERLEMPARSWSRRRFAYAALGTLGLLGGGTAAYFEWKKKSSAPERGRPAANPPLPERGSYAASRRAAEWLQSLPKEPGVATMMVLVNGPTQYLGIKETTPLPPGDWRIFELITSLRGDSPLPASEEFARHMDGLSHLRLFHIAARGYSEEAFAFLAHNTELQDLIIQNGPFGDGILAHLRGLKNLVHLRLEGGGERFTGHGIKDLACLPVVTDLGFRHCNVDDATVSELVGRAPKLIQIALSTTLVTDAGLRELMKIPTLIGIDVSECAKVTDAGLAMLIEMKSLKGLSLTATGVTYAGVEAFKKARPDCELIHSTSPPPEVVQYYKIKNINSNKVLAIDDRFNADEGAPIVQRIGGPKDRQLWRFVKEGAFYKIINGKSGMALTVQDASMEEGAPIVQSDASGARPNQQWTLQKTDEGYILKARHSGQVLDVENGAIEPKAPIIQYPFMDGRNQIFELKRVNTTDIPDPL